MLKRFCVWMVLLTIGLLLSACGGGGGTAASGTAGGGVTPQTPQVSAISLQTSAQSVKSDNSDSVTITATVMDRNNVVMPNQRVQFATTTGVISVAATTTDEQGKISATFSAGLIDVHNRIALVTATVPDTSVSASIPIQITGSTLEVAVSNSAPNVGTEVTLRATAKVADGRPASNQNIRFSLGSASTGNANLSASERTTNAAGEASITLTGTAAGQVQILIDWLDAQGNVTLSRTQTLTMQSASNAFEIVSPATSPHPVVLNTTQDVTVRTPATINGVSVSQIRYATTLGIWQANNAKVFTVGRSGDTDTQVFSAGNHSGNATIQVDALSSAGAVLATARTTFALSASAGAAASITLQPSVSVLAPSNAGNLSTANLTATVRDAANNAVGGASVLFELVNPTGSGESIAPVVVSTDSSGIATATFTAGTNATTQTSEIRATVVGRSPPLTASANITVGGTAGAVAIGTSSAVTSVNNDTSYRLPVTVMVTDSNGNAVGGATVSLSLWPEFYSRGTRATTAPCVAIPSRTDPNEDINENLILDPGEDIDGPLGVADGVLWPPLPSAGTIPREVVTKPDGTQTFDWVYLKEYADWIVARLRARVRVQGTEATTTILIRLPASRADVEACVLPGSPFGP